MRTHREASQTHGPKFETRVYDLLLANPTFGKVRRANLTEQKEQHFDVYAETVNGVILRVECKSIKDSRDDLFVVEGRTNCNAEGKTHPGWLFGGSNQIAVERGDQRITWIPTRALQRYIAARGIDWNAPPTTKKEHAIAFGEVYTRTQNNDRYPMIWERVRCAGLLIDVETRGDRLVYLPMSQIEAIPGVYTA